MRLLKQSNELEYKWHDVVFKIRSKATTGDKHKIVEAVSEMTELRKNGSFNTEIVKIAPLLVSMFVIGWSGVVDGNGDEISWSLENLYALPSDPKEDIVLTLGTFIMNNTDAIIDKNATVKKKD